MRPLGYMYKRVAARPDWLSAPAVRDIYSLSGCVSEDFAEYINFWKHNGFWLFDSPGKVRDVAEQHGISLDGLKLFYYEAHDREYDDGEWRPFEPEVSIETAIEAPQSKRLHGYDITTFSAGTAPECSPLSCNSCAATVPTNEHCLLSSFDEAKAILESDQLGACEPGPFRIIAVYSVNDA